jgi:hypothetical protein
MDREGNPSLSCCDWPPSKGTYFAVCVYLPGSGHRRNATERRQAIATGAVRGIDQAFGVRVPGRGSGIAVVVGEAALGAGLPILHPELPVAALPLAEG